MTPISSQKHRGASWLAQSRRSRQAIKGTAQGVSTPGSAVPSRGSCSAGLSYGRWAVEAVTIQEFRQYAHYLQPRAKHIMMEVRPRRPPWFIALPHKHIQR